MVAVRVVVGVMIDVVVHIVLGHAVTAPGNEAEQAGETINEHGVRVLSEGQPTLTLLATRCCRTRLSRMIRIRIRIRALALASTALSVIGCGSSNAAPTVASVPVDDAGAVIEHPLPTVTPPSGEAGSDTDSDGGDDGASAVDGGATPDAPRATHSAFIRLADWTPDAPSPGFDACVAPMGTTSWIGPLLAQTFPPGSLGQGGANGLQFPNVTQYFGIAPGQYSIQIIAAGSTDCTAGVLPATDLPRLALDSHTTIATVGDVNPRGNDTGLKVAVFFDDQTPPSDAAAMRVINTIPSVAYLDFGTGSLMAQNFAPLVTGAGFGVVGLELADGGTAGITGYFTVPPATDAQFSVHATGTSSMDTATATHVALTAKSLTTMVVINGSNGGFPPQMMVCTDSAEPRDEQTPCMVFAQ